MRNSYDNRRISKENNIKIEYLNMKKARDIEERAKSIYGTSSDTSFVRGQYCRGARDQEKIMKSSIIEKAIMWVKFHNENGGCNFDNWESSLKKVIDC